MSRGPAAFGAYTAETNPPVESAVICSVSRSAFALSLLLCSFAAAQNSSKTPTINQSLEMHSVSSPVISPDGAHVVYMQSRTDWDANKFESDQWVVNVATGERHLLTTLGSSAVAAQWSPDGKWIAFLSSRAGVLPKSPANKQQLWVMPAEGGEAQQLTKADANVDDFAWAPDSRHIALSAEEPESKAMKDREESFGEYHVVHADYEMTHLWWLEVPAADESGRVAAPAEPKLLTSGDNFSVGGFSISPDGKTIAFSATRDPDLISSATEDIYTVPTAGGDVKKIVETPGPDSNPQWSPDGSQIAYETSAGSEFYYYTNRKIAVVASSGGATTVLTDAFDEDPSLLRWTPEGIYFEALHGMSSSLYRLDAKTKAVAQVEMPGSTIAGQFSFTKDFSKVAYRGAGANEYAEIYTAALSAPKPVQLTHAGEQLKGLDVARREVVRWKSSDGTEIEGVLYKPENFDAKKKYPLLVVIHGGPTGIDMPMVNADRYYPVERFVAKGALVLKPNYRGSAGYGAKFRALNVRNLGVGDYADVISGVDSLIAQGFVDKDRVGSMGWSEGGYISAFITTSSDRFKAVSVGAGISDWTTYYVNTDITPFTRMYLHATPWSDPEIYRVTSPISYIAKAKTPTLIQHGGADHRVPLPNGYELRQALEDHGVPVKMVVYDGFGHPINKPKQQRAVMEENENWFAHYIWGEPLAPALTPEKKDEKKDK